MQSQNHSSAIDVARGNLLLGVFYVHALYTILGTLDPENFPVAAVQVKLLAPCVAAFFFLSGMTSRNLGRKSAQSIFQRSLMLLLLAGASHIIAALLSHFLVREKPAQALLRELAEPLITGVGHANFVGWFFVVLAATRIFAWIFERSKSLFAVVVTVAVIAMATAHQLQAPDFYQWSNWPIALLLFLCGMHIPEKLNIRWYVALPCLLLSFVIGWFNRPDFLESPSCMTCGLDFVAEPGIGEYGLLPLYLTQMFLFIAGLLWISAAMKNAFAGKVSAYFGRRSLMMLVIHGWIIVTLYQFPLSDLPPHDSIFFYISLICTVVILHAAVFAATQPVLWRFMTIISRVSAGIVSVLDWTKSSRSDEPQEYAATAKF